MAKTARIRSQHEAGFVAGVDGCPAGWVCALVPCMIAGSTIELDPTGARLQLVERFSDILNLPEAPRTIAIDIPIGLPDQIGPGGRGCDTAARSVLGARQSAVFAMPSRDAVMAESYGEACDRAYATSDPPRKISKQAFNLFKKVREVDSVMTPELQNRVFECHPELAFWALNGRKPLETPKKIKSRPNPEGLKYRRDLLAGVSFSRQLLEERPFLAREAGPDDLLDAIVNAWAAGRIANGEGVRFPDTPDRDRKGLRIEIWG
ncbi:MAG: DUF429 domain-containing protein [Pseudomonadota bacterium]